MQSIYFQRKIWQKIITKAIFLAFILVIFTNCSPEKNTDKDILRNLSVPLAVTANYLGSSSMLPASISRLNLSVNCEKLGDIGKGTISYVFSKDGNATNIIPGTLTALKVIPNDNSCTISIIDIVLTSGTYSFNSPLVITASNSSNIPWPMPVATKYTNGDLLYVSAKFSSYWAGSGAFNPSLNIIYGHNANIDNIAAKNNFSTVSLSATSTTGSAIPAPSYCIGAAVGTCDTEQSIANFSISYDVDYYVTQEILNIYPTSSSAQKGEAYKLIKLTSNNALVSTNNSSTTADSSVGTISGISGNCGDVKLPSDYSGCTYAVIDSLFNAKNGVNIVASGNVTGKSSATTLNSKILVNESNISAINNTWIVPDTTDFLGYVSAANVNIIPFNTLQSSVYYLIIQHKDGILANGTCTPSAIASCIPSYQLIILNGGHN